MPLPAPRQSLQDARERADGLAMPRRAGGAPDRLHELARRVERIGRGRTDPERILLEKWDIAAALRGLAREL